MTITIKAIIMTLTITTALTTSNQLMISTITLKKLK